MHDIFISYSRKDTQVAERICAAFDKAGITYFIDRSGIGGGFEFPVVLAEAIDQCKVVLFLASENSYASKFTNSELTFAFNEKPRNSILPYIIDGSTMPKALRFIFSSINWRTIETHPIETTLVDDILHLLGREHQTSAPVMNNTVVSDMPQPTSLRQFSEEEMKLAEGWCKMAQNEERNKNYNEAVKLYLKAAEFGFADAQFSLGCLYRKGLGVATDDIQANKWFLLAAEQGLKEAQNNLGYAYEEGIGLEQDYAQAYKWYSKAAEQDYYVAQCNLGDCYYYGRGVAKDYTEAAQYPYAQRKLEQ